MMVHRTQRVSIRFVRQSAVEWFDELLTLIAVLMVPVGVLLLFRGVTAYALFFQDIPDLPWGEIWEWLQGIGVISLIGRGGFSAWQKLSGREKFYKAIWEVLEESPEPLTKEEVAERVKDKLVSPSRPKAKRSGEAEIPKFFERFRATWAHMRRKNIIKKLGVRHGEATFILASDSPEQTA